MLRELGGPLAKQTSDYERLSYVHAVASETMRLRSVAPMLFLEPTMDVEIEGIAIPKRTTVVALTGHPGLRDANFGDAARFDPDRWLPGNERTHRPDSVAPFGYGPRHCPGRTLAMTEISAALAMLCTNFTVTKTEGHPPVEERFGFVVAATPIHVHLSAR